MTQLCPRCLQPLPKEKENEVESNLKELLQSVADGKVVGLWGELGYVTFDDLDKRKSAEIHAAHVGTFLSLLRLLESIENIKLYDSFGTADENSEFIEKGEEK